MLTVGKPEQVGRQTLDTRMWATEVIKDTPHGFMAKMLSKKPLVSSDQQYALIVHVRGVKCNEYY